ncbi:MAG TPA: thioredoxin domain-containing protein [Candidatus Paceibacterota bacterium]|nr:thioredoxin domain-containing protein [Candidatus Paceibacterota bacterium]
METNEKNNKYFLPLAVIVAGLFVGGAVIWSGSHPAGPAGSGAAPAPSVNIKDVNTAGNPFIGAANAPVTIAFWSDYQCPYCKAFEVGGIPQITTPAALPDIIKNYVDTGKVKIVFMDFVFLGNDSVTAALYGRSVWHLYPDQYFAWRTAMYNAQDQEGDQGFGNAASIDKLDATISGLDPAKIIADVAANKSTYQASIDADKAEAEKVGVNATPSFVIGTQMIAGAYPYAAFQTALDALLK